MKTKDLFILNLKTFIIDLIIFLIGGFLFFGFTRICVSTGGRPCPQPAFIYIGLILMLISVIHLIINLISFIYKKFKRK